MMAPNLIQGIPDTAEQADNSAVKSSLTSEHAEVSSFPLGEAEEQRWTH